MVETFTKTGSIFANKVGDSGFKAFTSGFKNINLSTASLTHKDK